MSRGSAVTTLSVLLAGSKMTGNTESVSATRLGIIASVGLSMAARASCAVDTNCVS